MDKVSASTSTQQSTTHSESTASYQTLNDDDLLQKKLPNSSQIDPNTARKKRLRKRKAYKRAVQRRKKLLKRKAAKS